MRQAGRVENFQPHMHLRGKAMMLEAVMADGSTRLLSKVDRFDFNWMTNYIYADNEAPLLPQGDRVARHVVVRQHKRQQEQSGSGSVGWVWRSYRR